MAPKYALITGCGQGGIGEALALEYQRHGCTVITTTLPFESKDHLTNKPGIHNYDLDVTSDESVASFATEVEKLTSGRLHVLVNNAGICYTMTGIDTDVTQVQKMFDVNVFGPMRMVRHFHHLLIETAAAEPPGGILGGRGAAIVNIGSVGGLVPYMYGASYNATKAALVHWGNTLRVEMKPLGVSVVNVISGNIGTNILKSDKFRSIPQGSYYEPLTAEFEAHVQRVPDTTPREVYASHVVPQTLKKCPPAWYWYGATTGIVRFADLFMFRTFWDYVLWPVFSLGKLKKANKARTGG